MTTKTVGGFPLILSGWILPLLLGTPSVAQSYLDDAARFLSAARDGWSQAQQLCQAADCSADLVGQIGALDTALGNLDALISQHADQGRVESAVFNATQLVHSVCEQMGGQCSTLFSGGSSKRPSVNIATRDPNFLPLGSCAQPCYGAHVSCMSSIPIRLDQCTQSTNRLLNCTQRVPFCDHPYPPLEGVGYAQDCGDFIRAGLLPYCRCVCPWSERQGGCPGFWTEPFTPCSQCSASSCQRGGDPRCSCRQSGATMGNWNSVQCDLCQWTNVGNGISSLRRSVCEAFGISEPRECRRELDDCLSYCFPPP